MYSLPNALLQVFCLLALHMNHEIYQLNPLYQMQSVNNLIHFIFEHYSKGTRSETQNAFHASPTPSPTRSAPFAVVATAIVL